MIKFIRMPLGTSATWRQFPSVEELISHSLCIKTNAELRK